MLAVAGDGFEQVQIVKLLLERGADVRARDRHGDTPLSLAQKDHKPEMNPGTHASVQKLLEAALAKTE